uniref:Uncharacterized protein n=1 Tax=Trypanosoma congolense (strain IL3000) TaxID=1068625 RepID=G0UZJ2_TRYCI|nr:hypothetical protein, unlikely [Trypanosoma congolense IL3000]
MVHVPFSVVHFLVPMFGMCAPFGWVCGEPVSVKPSRMAESFWYSEALRPIFPMLCNRAPDAALKHLLLISPPLLPSVRRDYRFMIEKRSQQGKKCILKGTTIAVIFSIVGSK